MLAPKRTGKLTIPALHLGAGTSAPLTLEVMPGAQAAKIGEARPVLLEVEAQPQQPYVQGQVIYSVRVLSRVPLREASLSVLRERVLESVLACLGKPRIGRPPKNIHPIDKHYENLQTELRLTFETLGLATA